MAGADKLRPTRLLALVGLLGLIFLLLVALAAVQLGPEVAEAVRSALGL